MSVLDTSEMRIARSQLPLPQRLEHHLLNALNGQRLPHRRNTHQQPTSEQAGYNQGVLRDQEWQSRMDRCAQELQPHGVS
jgi:hypothetical protein